MTESELQSAVRLVAKQRGWRAYRPAPARGMKNPSPDSRGWPDLTLVRGGRMLLLEFKGAAGSLRPEQLEWHEALKDVEILTRGVVQALVVRPDDYEAVVRLLA